MKTTKFITSLILCGALFAACNNDDVPGRGQSSSGDPAEVIISITNPSGGSATYGLVPNGEESGTAAENKVSDIEIYVFDDQGVIDSGTGNGTGYFSATVPQNATSFRYTVLMSSGDNKRLVTAVNMKLGALTKGQTYSDLKAKLSNAGFKASGSDYNSRTVPTDGFEMSGEIRAKIEAGRINSVSIPVSRLVSKINAPVFSNALKNSPTVVKLTDKELEYLWGTSAATIDTVAFKGISYALANGITKSNVLFNGRADGNDTDPKNAPWGDWAWTGKSYLNSSFDAAGKYTSVYSGQSATNDWLLKASTAGEGHVYVYENKPATTTVNGQTGFNPENTYAFVIKGELVVNDDVNNTKGLNKFRYWRVDLVRDNAYHILRNSSYYVFIKTISSVGFPTEEEAEDDPDIIPIDPDATSAEIEVVVNKWRLNHFETEM
ncbi:MAG: hypothetical protein LBH72_07390 [Proteiniphilum sp.]|nr:hypothetical protein [Proteiniphilum sp.]